MSVLYSPDINRKWSCLLLTSLLSASLYAADNISHGCNLEFLSFTTVGNAVEKLSRCYHRRSYREDREYIAAILEEDGNYTVIVQAGARGRDEVSLKIRHRKSQILNSIWHTHGAPGPQRDRYSPTDSRTVRATGLPFYLVTPDGTIKVLGQRKNGGAMSRVTQGWNAGTVIGSI